MKKTIPFCLSAIFALGLVACNPETSKQVDGSTSGETSNSTAASPSAAPVKAINPDAPMMAFTETEFDFGTIKDGDVVDHTFKFTNTGKTPLVIQNVTTPCGCTVPKQWPKEPIAPGASSEINIQFNSRGKSGQQNKVVTIIANTEPVESNITMKGNVEPGVSAMNGPLQN